MTYLEQQEKEKKKKKKQIVSLNYLLSYRDKCQKTIEVSLHQHPTFLQRYQKIIELIDWTLERYRIVIQRNKKNNNKKKI
jgi:hypothetical protein